MKIIDLNPHFDLIGLVLSFGLKAQETTMEAPEGFDVYQQNIPHGQLDTISYTSKTVGTSRKALIYTPPGFTKKKK